LPVLPPDGSREIGIRGLRFFMTTTLEEAVNREWVKRYGGEPVTALPALVNRVVMLAQDRDCWVANAKAMGWRSGWLVVDNRACRFLASPRDNAGACTRASGLHDAHRFTDDEVRYTIASGTDDLTAVKI